MNRVERLKAIETAVALAAGHPFVPAAVRVGLAALAEELRDVVGRLVVVERELSELKAH
jgi:hypothetical protein